MRVLLFSMIVLVMSCAEGGKEESKNKNWKDSAAQLQSRVMEIHDEVMPEMDYMRELRLKLEATADTLADSSRSQKFTIAAKEIEDASESMMGWMRNYEPPVDTAAYSAVKYLLEEEVSISEVNKKMKESIKKAEELLNVENN